MEKLDIFSSKKDIYLFILFCIFVFCISISFKYFQFYELQHSKFQRFEVVNQYKKISNYGEFYTVLKLKHKSSSFFTTSFLDIPSNIESIKLKAKFQTISFLEYLKGFFIETDLNIPSIKISSNNHSYDFIASQHKSTFSKELFLALFLAKPLSQNTRDKISNFGVAHLVAISGFHLGFLGGLFFGIFSFLYKFISKFFPFRNKFLDISIIVFILLFLYMYAVDFPPSLIRAYFMMIVIFILYINHFNIFSFEVLFIASLLAISVFPTLIFSLSFWFSVCGVFIIYLYLKFFKKRHAFLYLVGLNIWVFCLMQPISHTFFDKLTFYQFLSPLLSVVFIVFYPLEIVLHLVGYGGLIDEHIENLFFTVMKEESFTVDIKYFSLYIVCLLLLSKVKIK